MFRTRRCTRHSGVVFRSSFIVCLFLLLNFLILVQPSLALPEHPNFVLFLTDDQTLDSFSKMTYLSSRPYGDWITFDNAFISTPVCCPSRASILTGKYAHTVGVKKNDGRNFMDSQTLPIWLQAIGYQTSWIGKYLNGYPWDKGATYIPPGWSDWHALTGSLSYTNYKLNENGLIVSYGATSADYVTDVMNAKALQFLNNLESGPFMMVISYFAPHTPNIPAPRHKNLPVPTPVLPPNFNEADVSDKPSFIQKRNLLSSASQTVNMIKQEQRTMMAVDESIQAILDLLSAKEWLDNTVILFMTDNGFSRYSHRWYGKYAIYEESIRTPLMIRYPGSGGRTESSLVSNIDLTPTIVELSGASTTLVPHGTSLVPLLNNTTPEWRDGVLLVFRTVYQGMPGYYGVRTLTHKYVEYDNGELELYDLVLDPYELQNVAGNPDYAEIQEVLAAKLQSLKP
jgi:N-acetylglucosamine-6-sulfatase